MSSQIVIICPSKDCRYTAPVNSTEFDWFPPTRQDSVGSLRCPNCRIINDFMDWKLITSPK